jgi:hypothetical protein
MSEKSTTLDDKAQEDLRILFKVCADDLAFLKGQQWQITNYGLLLYAAEVGIVRSICDSSYIMISFFEHLFLQIIALSVLIFSWYVLRQLQNSINKGRERMRNVRIKLTEEFKRAWTVGTEPMTTIAHKRSMLWPLRIVLLFGFLTEFWLTFRFC